MATTTGLNGQTAIIEVRNPAGSGTWHDISGSTNAVETTTVKRKIGETNVFDTDVPLLLPGKKESVMMTINVLYTETTTEGYIRFLAAFGEETTGVGTTVDVRLTPAGTGGDTFTTGAGYVEEIDIPGVDSTTADFIMCSVKIRFPFIAHAT
jgi:hypothetical protein